MSESNTFPADEYLNQVLQARDKKLGVGSKHALQINIGTQHILTITDLTKEKAQSLFDLIDEHHNTPFQLTVLLLDEEGRVRDEAQLDNILSELP